MHHKRGRAKNRRSGCLMCKPHKANGSKHQLTHSTMKRQMTGTDDKRY